jgi:prepilin-type N-terminal cleavage/methylation domain-containing protein
MGCKSMRIGRQGDVNGVRTLDAGVEGAQGAWRRGSQAGVRVGFGRASLGFTLIELLVVISIIAVMIGILLPALSMARSEAQTTISKSNSHQIALGLSMYATDNRGIYPPTAHTGVTWMESIGLPAVQVEGDFGTPQEYQDYLGKVNAATKYISDPKAFVSPRDDSPFVRLDAPVRRWTSYSLNGYFSNDHPPYFGVKNEQVKRPSEAILVAEVRKEDEGASEPWEDHFTPQFFNDGNNTLGGFAGASAYNPANPGAYGSIGSMPFPASFGVGTTVDFTEDAEASWDAAKMQPNSTYDGDRYKAKWIYGFADGHSALLLPGQVLEWGDTSQRPTVNFYDPKH